VTQYREPVHYQEISARQAARNQTLQAMAPKDAYPVGVTSDVIVQEANAKYQADATVDEGAEMVLRAIYRLNRINIVIAQLGPDPAMLKLKETLTEEVQDRLRRYMRRGSGITETAITQTSKRQDRRY
jgi:hypothetical protein